MAGKGFLQLARQLAFDHQPVVIEQFFLRGNVAQRMDEHATFLFTRFTVRRAGMVDPARIVAIILGVDRIAVFRLK